MSNQPTKKKTLCARLSSVWKGRKSSRGRPQSPENEPQMGPRENISPSGTPSLRQSSPMELNPDIQSSTPPPSGTQAGSFEYDQPSSSRAKEFATTALSGAYELVKIAEATSGGLPPLKSALGGIVKCVEVYQQTSGNYKQMEGVIKRIDELGLELAAKLKESKDHRPLALIIKKFSKSLEEEDEKIKALQRRGVVARFAHNSGDAKELVSSCQAIGDAFNTFLVDIGFLAEGNTHDTLNHVVFQTLPRSHDADFSAAINLDNVSRGPCTKDTRVDVIKQIMEWVQEADPAKAPSVYWLNGLAGLGKTTIAYTICERLNEASVPFASFFCSRQLDSKNSKLLVTTLCRDLAEICPSFASEVLPVLQHNSKVVHAQLPLQMVELLAKPWQASLACRGCLPAPIIVVDALDESDRGTLFLHELLRVVNSGELSGIKFLVTSRPDPKLVEMCKSFPPNAVCKLHEVSTLNVQKDIEKYLCEVLPDPMFKSELGELAQQAGGLFIYAATVVRLISPDSPLSPTEKLGKLQALKSSWPTSAVKGKRPALDELYEQILAVAFDDAHVRAKRLQILHTILCVESRTNMSVIADLNNTDEDTVRTVVDSLHGVLFVSSKDDSVSWYHASFPDFLFKLGQAKFIHPNDPSDEINVFCDVTAHHAFLAHQCFSLMQELLHFNMCDLPSSYLFDSEVPDLIGRKHKELTSGLRYASQHWAKHLSRTPPAENNTNKWFLQLNKFMDDKLLFWIEAMNLIDATFECSSLLKDAKDWLEKGVKQQDLLDYLLDAAIFSATFAGGHAAKSTPHLYISALSLWSPHKPVWKHWKHRFTFIPSIKWLTGTVTVPLLTISTEGIIRCIAMSGNGYQIVSGDEDGAQVWDAKTGNWLRDLEGHLDVSSVAFSPDGNRIVSGSEDKSIWVWNAKTGEKLMELAGHTEAVFSVAFSPDGNRIVSGSEDRSVRVWDAKIGNQLMELPGHTALVPTVAFSPDSNYILSGSDDKSIRVWDAKTGKQLNELQGHTQDVTSVGFSPDGNKIVSGSWDKTIWVWDAKTGKQLMELKGHAKAVLSVTFSPDSNQIVSGSEDQSIQVWDAKTGNQLMELLGHTSFVVGVAFSPDGNQIVSGSEDRFIQVWDAKAGNQLRELEGHTNCDSIVQGHTDSVKSVLFSPDGNQIVSGSWDQSIRVWDVKTGNQLRVLQGHTQFVVSVAFSSGGDQIFSGSLDETIRVWDAKTGNELEVFEDHTKDVVSVAFSPDGNQFVSGFLDNSIQVWDAKGGNQPMKLQGHTQSVTAVAFSPDSNQIVSGSKDQSIRVWDAKTGQQLMDLQGHTQGVTSVAFSPDGNQIVSGSRDQSVRVWDAMTSKQPKELQGHTQDVISVAFSPDGNRIVSGSWDQSILVWDTKTGKKLMELQGHTHAVLSVAFSPDGNQIVSGSEDQSIRVWDATATNNQLGELQGHRSQTTLAASLPDENQITSHSADQLTPMCTGLDTLWLMDEDGWILSAAERLIWIPSTIGNCLHRPYTILVISRQGSAKISFEKSKLGPLWNECYTP